MLALNQLADREVLVQQLTVAATLCVPAGIPILDDLQAHACRMYFTAHPRYSSISRAPRGSASACASRSLSTTVRWEVRRIHGLKRPRAPKRRQGRRGPSFT